VLAGFAAVSMWVLALDLWQVVAHGRVWTGTDGFFLTDQMQYVAWVRDASHHVLASNLFVLRPSSADYLQPIVILSGAVSSLGVAPWLALLLWKPVAVIAAFFAVRAYARRSIAGRTAQRTVLVLGLFFASFGVIGDLWTAFWSWGYPFGLLSIAAMVAGLLAYDRSRATNRRLWIAPMFGALASALHPWQGETLILIVIGAELAARVGVERVRELGEPVRTGGLLRQRHLLLPAATVAASALPLLYYLILGHADESWELAKGAARRDGVLSSIAFSVLPLLIPALLAYRRRPRTFLAAVTRTWPVAALCVYFVSSSGLSGAPLHAFAGITIPLAVLAVEGIRSIHWRRVPHRRLVGWLAVAAFTIPGTAYEMSIAPDWVTPTPGNANFITRDEKAALDYLARDHQPGGVLSRLYLGSVVPAETGRKTFVGSCIWSQPLCTPRAQIAQELFEGSMTPFDARTFVAQTGARFLVADCDSPVDLRGTLGPMVGSVRHFGCASVYQIRAPSPPSGPWGS
jgi:hypothetical protein